MSECITLIYFVENRMYLLACLYLSWLLACFVTYIYPIITIIYSHYVNLIRTNMLHQNFLFDY